MEPTLITILVLQAGTILLQLFKYIKKSSCCCGAVSIETRAVEKEVFKGPDGETHRQKYGAVKTEVFHEK